MTLEDSVIRAKDLYKGFAIKGGVLPALDHLSLSVKRGELTVTDERMTRFWISLEQGVHFVIRCIEQMHGGEVFVPKIPSMKVKDLAAAVAPEAEIAYTGIRPGEKLHEVLISEDEARNTVEFDDMFIVQPSGTTWFGRDWEKSGKKLPDDYHYSSNNNTEWLDLEGIKKMIAPFMESYDQEEF